MTSLIVEAKPFNHSNVLRLVIGSADILKEESLDYQQIIAIHQKLQYENCFPLSHVYQKMGRFCSITIEEDINKLKSVGEIEKRNGTYRLTKRGMNEIIPMDVENLCTIVDVVKDVQSLSESEVKDVCKHYWQRKFNS